MQNYLYNTTDRTKIEMPDQPMQRLYGLDKVLIGKTFGNNIKPVQMYIKDGKLYLSNSSAPIENALPISENLRTRFDGLTNRQMEATEDDPIIWYITDKIEVRANSPIYIRVAVLGDLMLVGLVAGKMKVNIEGMFSEAMRKHEIVHHMKRVSTHHIITADQMREWLNVNNPITGKPAGLTGITDMTLEMEDDGSRMFSFQMVHSVAYKPDVIYRETERIERARLKSRKTFSESETPDLEEADDIEELEAVDLTEEDEDDWYNSLYADEDEDAEVVKDADASDDEDWD